MDGVEAVVAGEEAPDEEPLPVGGVLSSEQRELRGAASGRDAAGQQDAGLKPAKDSDAAESTDGEAEEAQVRGAGSSSQLSTEELLAWLRQLGHGRALFAVTDFHTLSVQSRPSKCRKPLMSNT